MTATVRLSKADLVKLVGLCLQEAECKLAELKDSDAPFIEVHFKARLVHWLKEWHEEVKAS